MAVRPVADPRRSSYIAIKRAEGLIIDQPLSFLLGWDHSIWLADWRAEDDIGGYIWHLNRLRINCVSTKMDLGVNACQRSMEKYIDWA